jgi:SAM-dependent methyltransferase
MGQDKGIPVDPPSEWVLRFGLEAPSHGRVLDLACGTGRHTRLFLDLGHPVLAVDQDTSWLADIAGSQGLTIIEADLEAAENSPPLGIAKAQFDVVVVTNYLHRPLLGWIAGAVSPGGILVYETFAVGNEHFGHPRNPDFLLKSGELLKSVKGVLRVIAYEHGIVERAGKKVVVQRIAAMNLEPSAPPPELPI